MTGDPVGNKSFLSRGFIAKSRDFSCLILIWIKNISKNDKKVLTNENSYAIINT